MYCMNIEALGVQRDCEGGREARGETRPDMERKEERRKGRREAEIIVQEGG